MRKSLKKIKDLLLESVFPSKVCCICCNCELRNKQEREWGVCVSCKKEFSYWGDKVQEIENKQLYIDGFLTMYAYDGQVRELIINFKDGNKPFLGEFVAEKLYGLVICKKLRIDGICYVPTSISKKRERGYDHMEIVARKLAQLSGWQLYYAFIRQDSEIDQTQSDDRYKNIEGQFQYINNQSIINKSLMIIDDVVTTGATASECSRLLKENGAKQVFLVTFAEAKSFDSYKHSPIKRMVSKD